jgi:HK97 family phage major capsid protein
MSDFSFFEEREAALSLAETGAVIDASQQARLRGFSKPGRRVRAFAKREDASAAGHWFKAVAGVASSQRWCAENGVGLEKASAESGGNVAGGFLVPELIDGAIIAVRDTYGVFRRECDVRPAKSLANFRPRRTGGLTANWVAENASIPESSFQFDAVQTTLRKLAILARSSTELWEDEAADLGEFLVAEIGQAFALAEDTAGFLGDGTSTYMGMRGLSSVITSGMSSYVLAASSHNTFAGLTQNDLASLMAGVREVAIPNSAWYGSAVAFAQTFCRLSSAGFLETRMLNGVTTPFYLGFPVMLGAALPNTTSPLSGKPMLFFGDLEKAATIVDRRGVVVAISQDRALDTDQILVRATERVDIVVHLGGAGDPGVVAVLVGN